MFAQMVNQCSLIYLLSRDLLDGIDNSILESIDLLIKIPQLCDIQTGILKDLRS